MGAGRGASTHGRSAARSNSWARCSPSVGASASMPSVRADAYGLPATTASSAALETYDRAVDGLLSWDAEALDRFGAPATTYPGSSFMLGLHAFALEQAGRCDEALRIAQAAIGKNPRDAWSVHALAHALYELGAFDTGVTRLPPAIHPCARLGWFRNHLLWHLILMHLGRGEYERAFGLGRTVFEREPSSIPGDLHDSISLLWRLELCGLPVKDRWRPFPAIAPGRLDLQPLLFHAAHLAMALAAGGDWATAERQLGMLRERAARDRPGLTGQVLVPLVEGLHAFPPGGYRRPVGGVHPLRRRSVRLGGGRPQRHVVHDP